MSTVVKVILGRDGMGEYASEADFAAWVAYVEQHLSVGFAAEVETAPKGGEPWVIRGADGADVEGELNTTLASLWDAFVADNSAWPSGGKRFTVIDPKTNETCAGLASVPSDHAQLMMLVPDRPLDTLGLNERVYARTKGEVYLVCRHQ